MKKKTTKKTKTKSIQTVEANEEIQQKYDDCVQILSQLHNAIALALSVTDEYDDKEPIELVQMSLDNYKEFLSLSDEEIEQLRLQESEVMEQLKEVFPELEVIEPVKTQTSSKKGLLN